MSDSFFPIVQKEKLWPEDEIGDGDSTRQMVRTPYGVLSMSMKTFAIFSDIKEERQWRVLAKTTKAGFIEKARAMQWYWNAAACK